VVDAGELAAVRGQRWFGFERVHQLDGVPPEILLLPLPGHTHGHAAVAVDRGDTWLLYAGDAYFFHAEMDPVRPRCTPGLRFYQWMMEQDRTSRLANQRRLRELCDERAAVVDVFCAHDVSEFERLSGRSAEVPQSAFAQRGSVGPTSDILRP
jgi:glyoxylase-like metal-dependent hydrolase (beta-lactamase superfamily II)